MSSHRQILLVSGSTRAASTNTAALRVAHAMEDEQITTVLDDGLSRSLPPTRTGLSTG
jgi:hypothetical protein